MLCMNMSHQHAVLVEMQEKKGWNEARSSGELSLCTHGFFRGKLPRVLWVKAGCTIRGSFGCYRCKLELETCWVGSRYAEDLVVRSMECVVPLYYEVGMHLRQMLHVAILHWVTTESGQVWWLITSLGNDSEERALEETTWISRCCRRDNALNTHRS